MGKKSKGTKRAIKESRALEAEVATSKVEAINDDVPDEDLFEIDTEGSKLSKRKRMKLEEEVRKWEEKQEANVGG